MRPALAVAAWRTLGRSLSLSLMQMASGRTRRSARPHRSAMLAAAVALLLLATLERPDAQVAVSPAVAPFVTVREPVVALEHVRVVDGTGAPARDDQTVVIADGRIAAVGTARQVRVPRGARRIDLTGHTVIPGLVGLHEHLFYPVGPDGATSYMAHSFSFPRLYLAGGVTTARTAGTFEPRLDLDVGRDIEIGLTPGPKLLVTAGYIDGVRMATQLPVLTTAEEARAFVDEWAARGVHSFKLYTQVSRVVAAAVIDAAHARGLTVTGHLCSLTFREAVELGIDNLEHGFIVATDWVSGKMLDQCPADQQPAAFARLDVNDRRVQELIQLLVTRRVAITSTLAVTELPEMSPRFRDALSPRALQAYVERRTRTLGLGALTFDDSRKEVALERAFVQAGGLLVAGADPTGDGQVLPGFGDQRNIEMLVAGGFTPVEAIRIATLNGAELLRQADRIGSIVVGKQADLVVLDGNPVTRIEDVERVVTVFVDGIGYDSARLLASVNGQVGVK